MVLSARTCAAWRRLRRERLSSFISVTADSGVDGKPAGLFWLRNSLRKDLPVFRLNSSNEMTRGTGLKGVGDMIASWKQRISGVDKEIWLFLAAVAAAGFAGSMVDATFNNYLNETFHVSDFQRSILEVPRELPGLLVVFVSACLFFLCSRRLAVLAMAVAAVGLVLIGSAGFSFNYVLVWLFIYSLGQHIFLPLNSSIGMDLAREGKTGRRLGQINSMRNLATLAGSFFIFIGFRFFHFTFAASFLLASVGFGTAALLLYGMKPAERHTPSERLRLRREYGLFYWLTVLYGARKQIFLTFAPWVLVTLYRQPTQTLATLLTLGAAAGIVFQPWLGRLIDTRGERFVLAGEALVLIAVCLLYGFAGMWFSPGTALAVVAACYVIDQLLMSVSMARATYLKKIAMDPAHVTPTLTAATSIDHVFSITTALVSGWIWKIYGYQYVFLLGAVIAAVNFISTLAITLPDRSEVPPDAVAAQTGGAD